jgi:hypothetical protein
MKSHGAAVPALDEQHSGFNYGYRMNCDCDCTSYISAADYHAKTTVDALMQCNHCGRAIHFGPAIAALRDPNDPVLDNKQINRLAWYHTSTQSDWPSASYANDHRATLLAGAHHFSADRVDAYNERQLNQTLHVGTYEAAIENMLRRMRNQDDATSQFYLHRITLVVDPDRINDGYRDENHEPAAQLTTADLRESGFVAVRYLNVYESIGSLSLAVLPETITCLQTISLPVATLAPAHDDSLLSLLSQTQTSLDDLRANAPDTSTIAPTRLRMMQLVGPDPDGIGAASAVNQRKTYELWNSIGTALTKKYLTNTSPVVQDQFEQAMSTWRREQAAPNVRQFADFFAASAVTLTRLSAVRTLLATHEPRARQAPRRSNSESGDG